MALWWQHRTVIRQVIVRAASHSATQSVSHYPALPAYSLPRFGTLPNTASSLLSLSLFLSFSLFLFSILYAFQFGCPGIIEVVVILPYSLSLSLFLFLSCISHPLGACKCCCIHKHSLPDVASVSLRSLISETDVSVNVFSVFFVVIHQLMGFRFFQFVPVCNICMNLSSFKQKQSCSSLQAPQLSASTTFSTFKATVTK